MPKAFDLQAALAAKRANNLFRSRLTIESPQQPQLVVNGESYLAFCSNDYLGLANDERIKRAFHTAIDECGVGSGASHLVAGHHAHHHALEEELAEFTGRDRVLLFSSGYMANLGVINALLAKGDTVVQDKLNHASLLDGGLSSGAKFLRYRHGDIDSASQQLARADAGRCLMVTDGVFSMDGDKAPLQELAKLASNNNAWLMVDDAHGFACLGETGAGLLQEQQLSQKDVPVLMATLGKAVGCAGAFVAGSDALIETLIQSARSYIYTTALPPAVAAACRESLKIIATEPERRQHLKQLIQRFRQGAEELGLNLMPSETAIQPLLLGSSEAALSLSAKLREEGILVTAIRPPTVPKNTARLRIALSASHSNEHIDRLLSALAKYCVK